MVLALGALLGGCAAGSDDGAEGAESADRTEATGSTSSAATTGESYYAVLFGSQDALNRPARSHTFATFVRAYRGSSNGPLTVLEQRDVSWLPADFEADGGEVCVAGGLFRSCSPETGHNYTLAETLAFAEAGTPRPRRVAYFGPYAISATTYRRAALHIDWLEQGSVLYIAQDGPYRDAAFAGLPGGAINCMDAAGAPFGFQRSGLQWGIRGTKAITDEMGPYVVGVPSRADTQAIVRGIGLTGHTLDWQGY